MIKFHIPGIVQLHDLNMCLISLFKAHREYFYDDIEIAGVYGVVPPCLWNGGRCSVVEFDNPSFRHDVVRQYNDLGVGVFYTFTNKSLEPSDYDDPVCHSDVRVILEHSDLNGIIVADENLRVHLEQVYGRGAIRFVLSTTSDVVLDGDMKSLETKEFDYDAIVANHSYNNTGQLFAVRHPEKYELLVNPQCVDFCEFEKMHYQNVSDINAGKLQMSGAFKCRHGADKMHALSDMAMKRSFISVDDLYSRYKACGFEMFKINGRHAGWLNVASYYAYYMVRPEYANLVMREFSDCVNSKE